MTKADEAEARDRAQHKAEQEAERARQPHTTEIAALAARELANALFKGPCTNRRAVAKAGTGLVPCHEQERLRDLTRAEKDRGWSRRPFQGYNPDNMCRGCACYWHAERTACLLEEAVAVGAALFDERSLGRGAP